MCLLHATASTQLFSASLGGRYVDIIRHAQRCQQGTAPKSTHMFCVAAACDRLFSACYTGWAVEPRSAVLNFAIVIYCTGTSVAASP